MHPAVGHRLPCQHPGTWARSMLWFHSPQWSWVSRIQLADGHRSMFLLPRNYTSLWPHLTGQSSVTWLHLAVRPRRKQKWAWYDKATNWKHKGNWNTMSDRTATKPGSSWTTGFLLLLFVCCLFLKTVGILLLILWPPQSSAVALYKVLLCIIFFFWPYVSVLHFISFFLRFLYQFCGVDLCVKQMLWGSCVWGEPKPRFKVWLFTEDFMDWFCTLLGSIFMN